MIVCNIFGLLIWSVRTAHGAGDLIKASSTESGSVLSWNVVYGIQAVLGLWSGGIVGQSGVSHYFFFFGNTLTSFLDWTRYAKTPNASLFGQGVTCPLTIIITALCGLIVTSASAQIYGQYFWNPFELLLHIQSVSMTPAARAGTFFSGLAFLASQMALCIVLNAISTGMDMAALCPRWINIRRGCFILTIIAVAICPWNYVNNVTTFITVLSGWSIFLSGMTGILIFDYFLVRRCQLHKGDMYRGDKTSAYWYTAGFNWRAIVAWIMGVWPLLRTLNSIFLLQHIILTAGQLALFAEYKARVTATHGTMSMISAISSGS
jgi:NCS1 family nucleobase:cation symporter-1